MADPNPCSSASLPLATNFTLEHDDISTLLNTLLHNSSLPSTASASVSDVSQQQPTFPSSPQENRRQFYGSAVFSGSAGFDLSTVPLFTYPRAYYASEGSERTENAFPGAIASSMERIGEFDCESEKDNEASEAPANPAPVSNSSKRSRAAEVHNLSEKRRRQRINEKMKALQKLIPNSNKTDKASMLDEAIEYLKQLQLQVQMLAMRNGSTLHPLYLPGVVPSVQPPGTATHFAEGNGMPSTSRGAGCFSANQEISFQNVFDLSDRYASLDQKILMPVVSEDSNSQPSIGLEPSSSVHHHIPSNNLSTQTKELCKDTTLPQLQLEKSHGENSSSGVSF
ncbi:hypothetical protein Nepgr_015662 [Nepenthes gracilis]|uniref:BHLH domain-containing protein n=1 Tax=Nepenthes gracilis TaxID=150966 RepID=A0AAD3SNW4_NEPGR|nr:hypothetical protein Nepgr_015662 [Nepenthes gracilis]